MKRRVFPRAFCLSVRLRYLWLKLLEALGIVRRETPELTVIAMINRKTLGLGLKVAPDKVLLLLPHCLQHHDCPHRITFSIENCRRCGRCVVGELAALSGERGVEARVTTGGTLARRLLAEKRPGIVVAVACPRDLGQGMMDALPLPSLGVLNSRPNGDCFDTSVQVSDLRRELARVLPDRKDQ